MCYSVEQLLVKNLKKARKDNAPDEVIKDIRQRIQDIQTKASIETASPLMYCNGFDHPELWVYRLQEDFLEPIKMQWGLIPPWVTSATQAASLRAKTLNAREEGLFETKSYKDAIPNQRGIISVPSFYEYYHLKSKAYPFNIYQTDKQPMLFAVIWASNPLLTPTYTFSVVTTQANDFMGRIHNKVDKTKRRMPLILDDLSASKWLTTSTFNSEIVSEIIEHNTTPELNAHVVAPLTKNKALTKSNPYTYAAIDVEDILRDKPSKPFQGSLF